MDEVGRDNRRHRSSTAHQLTSSLFQQWNTMPQYQQFKEQNAFSTTAKIGMLCEEKEAALKERDRAVAETKAILEEMELTIKQRDAAIAERDNALKERDNAIAALQFHENTMNALLSGGARGLKRMIQPTNNVQQQPPLHHSLMEECIYDAFPVSAVQREDGPTSQKETRTKTNKKVKVKSTRPSKKSKKIGEDLNRKVTTDGSKAEWEAQDLGSMDQMIMFDESTMPVPVCSCTGVAHQCYKWGNGGWQSSCCTTALSEYPLPQMPNKRHARMGGRKMSGSVFSRLLTRLGTGGYDLSIPLDLKNYWARHGTNRYITIK